MLMRRKCWAIDVDPAVGSSTSITSSAPEAMTISSVLATAAEEDSARRSSVTSFGRSSSMAIAGVACREGIGGVIDSGGEMSMSMAISISMGSGVVLSS